jgi:lysyl-tRNA synthetase class 2
MQKISLKNKTIYPHFLGVHQKYHEYIKEFLTSKNYNEYWCPPLSSSPCFETHVHPLEIYSTKNKKRLGHYLHTSPEFILKSYACNLPKKTCGLFNLNYVFRDDEPGQIHRKQFIMLEFYKLSPPTNALLEDLKLLVISLSSYLNETLDAEVIRSIDTQSVDELFKQYLKFSILDFNSDEDLFLKISKDYSSIAPPQILPWDDLYHLLWLNYIEPKLSQRQALLVTEFPSQIGLLSKKNEHDPRTCERFELFIHGTEIANGYAEETKWETNVQTIRSHLAEKQRLYDYVLEEPEFFLHHLKSSTLPSCHGVAVGTERLLQVLTQAKSGFIDLA